jgi:hypothetical protein
MPNPNPSPETRFQPGCAPGPGRPRTKPITDRLRARLEGAIPDGTSPTIDLIVDQWFEMIAGHNSGALREMLDRLEGKVTDRVEHDGEVTIRIEYADGPDDRADDTEAASGPEEDPPGCEAI